jgi:hypothetical protein
MRPAFAVLAILLVAPTAAGRPPRATPDRPVARAPRVGDIENLRRVGETVSCGFYFQRRGARASNPARYVFIAGPDGRDAWMNLDGRDVQLELARVAPYPGERIGARRAIEYRAPGGYRVRVVTVVVRLSDENNYEPTRFRVTLTVARGAAKTVVRADGSVGC